MLGYGVANPMQLEYLGFRSPPLQQQCIIYDLPLSLMTKCIGKVGMKKPIESEPDPKILNHFSKCIAQSLIYCHLIEFREINHWSRTQLILFLAIAISVLTPPAHGEDVSNQPSCGSSAIVAMLKEIADLRRQLRTGEVSRPTIYHRGPNHVDVTDIARKYIRVECELTKLRIDLINAGFKLEDSREGEEPPSFDASIFLKSEWWRLSSVEFRLEIEHELGHLNFIKGTLFYFGL